MPKITIIHHQVLLSIEELQQFPMNGRVVMRHYGASIDGPSLVCIENANQPVMHNGCPNGGVRFFLADLQKGERYNLALMPQATTFCEVDCELVVKEL